MWQVSFGKSSAGYATWLVAGILVSEGITGWGTDVFWNSVNSGRTYESVDWSKFIVEDDEDEDEEEEEEEDDDEEGEEDEDEDDDEWAFYSNRL